MDFLLHTVIVSMLTFLDKIITWWLSRKMSLFPINGCWNTEGRNVLVSTSYFQMAQEKKIYREIKQMWENVDNGQI